MGGKALKTMTTRRVAAAEYHEIKDEVVGMLRSMYPGHRIEAIPAYRRKPDFGDLDILVEYFSDPERPDTDIRHRFRGELHKHFKAEEIVSNGPVYSFAWRDFQVDLILAPSSDFEMSLNYFSWNDLGNLIGRVAHKMGLKYGHDGLSLPFRVETYLFDTLVVTRDAFAAIEFLGMDPERFRQGFDTPDEFYQFVADGKYFDPDIYQLENRSNKARTRDRKRPIYRGFLEWIVTHNVKPRFTDWPAIKATWLPKLFVAFPDALDGYLRIQENFELSRKYQAKFNGQLVSSLTGLSGKELGHLMMRIRTTFDTRADEAFRRWVVESSDADIENLIRQQFELYQREQQPA